MSFFSKLVGLNLPLHQATLSGDLAKVQQAVQKGTDNIDKVDKVSSKRLLLLPGLCLGSHSIFLYLQEGCTALHIAASRGYTPIMGELLDRHASSNVFNLVRINDA
jgi:ankyrin repeat protein